MPLQLTNYIDRFSNTNAAAYLKVMGGSWDARTGKTTVHVDVWCNQAAYAAGADPVWSFSATPDVDPTALQAAIEAQLKLDPNIAGLSPQTVA